jgi:hypothetical protein
MTKIFIANLIINFNVEITKDEIEIDEITGNPVIIDSESIYKVKAHIRGLPSILQEMGSNPNQVNVEGKIVETWNQKLKRWENNKILPTHIIRYQTEATAVYLNPDEGFEQNCYFTLQPDVDSKRPRVARRLAKRLGSDIKGILRF